MRITIETIPHHWQRYPTCGDWTINNSGNDIDIKISETGNWEYNALVAVHELIEVLLCAHENISQTEVDEFDIEFEKHRPEGSVEEPGDNLMAPYRKQHCIATGIERIVAAEMNVSWSDYEALINSL
jgi:hypothetical protein